MNIDLARENLKSKNTDVILSALRIIGASGQLTDLQLILKFIKSTNQTIKTTAISAVSDLIRRNLISHFEFLDTNVRKKLSNLMESLHPGVIQKLSDDIYSKDEKLRLNAVQVLGMLKKNPKVRDILADLVKDRDVKIKATAVNLLGRLIGPNDHDLILSLLKDKDKRVRANTVEAIESLGNKRLIPILLRFRKDPSNRIRGNVIKALYSLGHKDISEDLLNMIETPDDFMQASGLWVITQIKYSTPELVDSIGHCLISGNEMVITNAKNALEVQNTPRAKGYLKYLT